MQSFFPLSSYLLAVKSKLVSSPDPVVEHCSLFPRDIGDEPSGFYKRTSKSYFVSLKEGRVLVLREEDTRFRSKW